MAYIVPRQLRPYNCSYCGTVFTAMTVPHQVSTPTPCPYCQENKGNIRADKRTTKIGRETFNEFLPISIKSAWSHLVMCYHAFNEKYADNDEASFFFPEHRHPSYDVSFIFTYQISDQEWLEFHLDPDYNIHRITYHYDNQTLDLSNDPDAIDIFEQAFDIECLEMIKQKAADL